MKYKVCHYKQIQGNYFYRDMEYAATKRQANALANRKWRAAVNEVFNNGSFRDKDDAANHLEQKWIVMESKEYHLSQMSVR